MVKVIINIYDFKRLVNPCSPEVIENYCFARCCRYSTFGLGHPIIIPVKDEVEFFRNQSNSVQFYDETLGIFRINKRGCPFQDEITNFCKLHLTNNKPYGCRMMPLMLDKRVICVRSFLKSYYCQKKDFPNVEKVPFYIGFRQSLVAVFGEDETNRIAKDIENNKKEIVANISDDVYERIVVVKETLKKVLKR